MNTPEDTDYARHISQLFFRDLASNGTTTCCIHGPYFREATNIAFQVAEKAGLRILMGMNAGDNNLPEPLKRDAEVSIKDAEELCIQWDGANSGRLSYCWTVRPAYCASDRLLRGVAKAARSRTARIQCHLGESEAGRLEILDRFLDCSSETQVYDMQGLLGPQTIMAHGIHLSDDDYELLANRKVSLAHCPRANLLSGGSQLNLRKVQSMGIPVGLGTDLGGRKGISLCKTLEDTLKVTPCMQSHDVTRLATIEGARALGLDSRIGTLEKGKDADFLLIDIARLKNIESESSSIHIADLLGSLIFNGSNRSVEKLWVNGECCYRGSVHQTVSAK